MFFHLRAASFDNDLPQKLFDFIKTASELHFGQFTALRAKNLRIKMHFAPFATLRH